MSTPSPSRLFQPPDDALSRWLFLRLLGLVYLIAFASLYPQIEGLVGSRGILPAAGFLETIREQWGVRCYWRMPTWFWLHASDSALAGTCAAGMLLAVLLAVGFAPLAVLPLLWACYLSLMTAGQVFLGYQWDTLLLETGFCAMFVAPVTIRPRFFNIDSHPAVARWPIWFLAFKLMFLSGATKVLSGDVTWRNFTALTYHYETQPLPNAVGWYAHQLPDWCQRSSVVLMLGIELLVPFLIFVGRTGRKIAAVLLIGLQLVIAATGNYGFFNLLAIVVCIPLVDDVLLRRLLLGRWKARYDQCAAEAKAAHPPVRRFHPLAVPVGMVLFTSGLAVLEEMVFSMRPEHLPRPVVAALGACQQPLINWGQPYLLDRVRPFRTFNGYGLFRVMTTRRPEIVIEGSRDGETWIEYSFRWKAGELDRRPGFVAPHQPRLDWQMWFAALGPDASEYWLRPLMRRLLSGTPEVLALLGEDPFRGQPPRYVRLVYYRYEFTDLELRGETGRWWRRTRLGDLTTPFSLQEE